MNWGAAETNLPYTSPRILNIKLYGATSWINTIEFKDTSDGTDIDISQHTFTLTIKRNAFDEDVVKSLTLDDGLSVSGANNNILTINTVIDFKSGKYVYDLIGTTATGEIIPYLKGKIKVEENV